MKARLYLSPLDQPIMFEDISRPTRLSSIMPQDGEVFERLADGGVVRLNGHLIPPDRWHLVTLKPTPGASLDIVYVPSGKKTFALLATVAVIALTTAITGGLAAPFLGAGFAAGTFGATALAAGVGLAGSLLIGALTAPPKAANQGEEKSLTQAGVGGNTATILEPLPVVFGKIGVSPPLLAPPYTTWDGDNITAYAAVGLQGRCLIENIKVNGLPIADIAGIEYETREGRSGDSTERTMFTQTVIEERDGITLTNFQTELANNKNDLLIDQSTPDNSSPQWHYFRTAGEWTEAVLRFLFPSGLVKSDDGGQAFVPIRIQIRKVGDVAWRNLPTLHASDVQKGSGPFRFEVRLERRNPTSGCHFSSAFGEYPIFEANNLAAIQESFAYAADSYFAPVTMDNTYFYWKKFELALFSSATNANGYTWSASSTNGSNHPWQVHDGYVNGTYWRPTDNTLGTAYIQLACPSPQTFLSYFISENGSPTTAPTKWRVYGSNDGVNFTALDDDFIDITEDPQDTGDYQIGNPGAYSYYRWVFHANNGASNQQLRIDRLVPSYYDSFGCVYDEGSATARGNIASHGYGYYLNKCRYVSLDKRGARVFLRPDQWDAGEYEIRVMRGVAGQYSKFDSMKDASGDPKPNYSYDGNGGNWVNYFGYFSSGGYKIQIGQKNYRSDCTIEAFQTINDESPFDDTGVAMIAVFAPNIQISSIFAEFTRYAPEWDGTIWSATEVPTQNPAALYRQLLLGAANAKPVNGEAVPEDELADWFETCDANGYECNAVMQGARVGEAKQMIATAGYASPRDAETYGVVEDKDTTSEPVRVLLSPLNSRNEGDTQELADLPDAIRAEFNDAAQSYALEHAIVYREGMDATSARIFETISYPGFTDQTRVEARAAFDLKQAHMRQVRYSRRVGLDGALLRRGSLIGISDETVDGKRAAGWITAVAVNGGGNVTSITLDNVMPWSGSDSIEDVEDFESIADLLDPSVPMGVAIRIPGSNVLVKQVSDVSDSNVCTFTTPFPLAGSGLEDILDVDGNVTGGGYMVVAGEWGNVYRRCKVVSVVPQGFEERLIVAVDEAPGLYD